MNPKCIQHVARFFLQLFIRINFAQVKVVEVDQPVINKRTK